MTITRRIPLKRSTKPIKRRKSLKKQWAKLTRKKPLKRTRTKIKARAKFHAHGDNPLKSYRRRFTDYQVTVRANICRQDRLRDRTRAEICFCEILDGVRVLYESEAVVLNGDRWVLLDVLVRSAKIAFEVDGSAHDDQKEYDAGRDAWLLRVHKIRTIRLTNEMVFKNPVKVRTLVMEALQMAGP